MKTDSGLTLTVLARLYFGVTLPVERATLKTLYRTKARQLHTDASGTDATREAFIAMQQAYEKLTDAKAVGVFTDGPKALVTEEGTPLSDLGLGLGALKNGTDCSECKGIGYHERKRKKIKWFPYEPCYICRAMGSTWGCIRCGHLYFKHTDTVEVYYAICAPCQGKGEIEIFNPVIPKGFLSAGPSLGQKARKRAAKGMS